jgi:hypothetical protein
MKCKVAYGCGRGLILVSLAARMVAGITYSARPAMGSHPSSCSVGLGALSLGVKRPVRDIYHLPLSSPSLRIGRTVNLRRLYAVMSWKGTVSRLPNPGKNGQNLSHDWLSCITRVKQWYGETKQRWKEQDHLQNKEKRT